MYTDYLEHKSKNNDKNMMADQHSFEFDKIHTSTGMTCKAKIVANDIQYFNASQLVLLCFPFYFIEIVILLY